LNLFFVKSDYALVILLAYIIVDQSLYITMDSSYYNVDNDEFLTEDVVDEEPIVEGVSNEEVLQSLVIITEKSVKKCAQPRPRSSSN
jgi:hypothetical protein